MLLEIPPESIFEVPNRWDDSNRGSAWEDDTARFFGYWREFYIQAAGGQDAVLIGSA
ncbi:MAG: hypothetical protein KME10_23385 [Plectolyngbya sp. WJT66-NPBG17]|nr:hypothetical protein [Plectolyngbya sp. WJT66-NPBG17]